VSNVGVEELQRARVVGEIVSVQNRYNLGDRESEDVLAVCERAGIAFLPWFPIAAGALAGADELQAVASAHGATAAQVALACLLQRSPVMLPIPGTSSIPHLEENTAAAGLRLSAEEVRRLSTQEAHDGGRSDRPAEARRPGATGAARRRLHPPGAARRVSESEVMTLHGMEPNAPRVLRDALEERGLSFRDG
jgi:aryl-alcohol dehydrogenase-like predicted oxidoreductase